MNKNSQVWDLSSTCKKVHAYIGGVALCRKNILHPGGDQFSHLVARRDFKSLVCVACEHKAFIREEIANLAHAEALEINATPRALVAPEPQSLRVRTDELVPGDRVRHPYEMECFTVSASPETLVPHLGFHNRTTDERESGMRVTGTDDNGETVYVDAAQSYLWTRAEALEINNNEETDDMKPTKHKGPLSPLQHQILALLCEGLEHAEIAMRVGFSRSYISEHVCASAAKMGLPTTAAAVARYGSYRAYLGAADLLLERGIMLRHVDGMPLDPAEEHANHVVEMLAKTLRERAERLLPS